MPKRKSENLQTSELRTRRWYNYTSPQSESVFEVSETVPGRGLTVSQIIDRHTQGIGIPTYAGEYFDDSEIPDPRGLSRLEYMDWYRDFQNELAIRQADAEAARAAGETWTKPEVQAPLSPQDYQEGSRDPRKAPVDPTRTFADGSPVQKTPPPPVGDSK
jgi:hypothetical protein